MHNSFTVEIKCKIMQVFRILSTEKLTAKSKPIMTYFQFSTKFVLLQLRKKQRKEWLILEWVFDSSTKEIANRPERFVLYQPTKI